MHGGRLELTVLKVEMSKARQKPYPWRKAGAADIFGELPFGTDQRGRPIGLPLLESNMLIGSLPGAGRSRVCGVCCWAARSIRRLNSISTN